MYIYIDRCLLRVFEIQNVLHINASKFILTIITHCAILLCNRLIFLDSFVCLIIWLILASVCFTLLDSLDLIFFFKLNSSNVISAFTFIFYFFLFPYAHLLVLFYCVFSFEFFFSFGFSA
jgi:hypothetical protein